MPKPKTFLREAKTKKKTKKAEPATADEYLAEGVDLEEAGEKWRAGDPVKSMRFFMRAIEMYDTGLKRFTDSFDLAYNKARVQYEITQHPKLSSQLPAPLVEILHIALTSHKEALNKQQDNADILFNTAQVFTSLAEAITDGKRSGERKTHEALKYLQEALELFQRCLMLQELQFTERQEQIRMSERDGNNGNRMEGSDHPQQPEPPQTNNPSSTSAESEEWAAVIEPVTKNTLIDTAVAQLETLATLCGLLTYDPGSSLAWVEEYSSDLLREKIAAYVDGTDRGNEVAIARAKFISTLAEISYRSGRIDLETYKDEIGAAFGNGIDLSEDPSGLCSQADALVAFNTALADTHQSISADTLTRSLDLRWQALSLALDRLTAASKLPHADNLPKIHIARGDAEMYRRRLGSAPFMYPSAKDNGPTLLKNAETYYRGGAAIARRDGWIEEGLEGAAKEAIAKGILGDFSKMEAFAINSRQDMMRIAEEMVEDGLVAAEDMEKVMLQADPDEIVF